MDGWNIVAINSSYAFAFCLAPFVQVAPEQTQTTVKHARPLHAQTLDLQQIQSKQFESIKKRTRAVSICWGLRPATGLVDHIRHD